MTTAATRAAKQRKLEQARKKSIYNAHRYKTITKPYNQALKSARDGIARDVQELETCYLANRAKMTPAQQAKLDAALAVIAQGQKDSTVSSEAVAKAAFMANRVASQSTARMNQKLGESNRDIVVKTAEKDRENWAVTMSAFKDYMMSTDDDDDKNNDESKPTAVRLFVDVDDEQLATAVTTNTTTTGATVDATVADPPVGVASVGSSVMPFSSVNNSNIRVATAAPASVFAVGSSVLPFSSVNNSNITVATAAAGFVFPPTTAVTTSTVPFMAVADPPVGVTAVGSNVLPFSSVNNSNITVATVAPGFVFSPTTAATTSTMPFMAVADPPVGVAAVGSNVLPFSSVNSNNSMATAAPGFVFPPTTTVTTSTMPFMAVADPSVGVAAVGSDVLPFSSVNNISMATAAPGFVFPPSTTVTTSTVPFMAVADPPVGVAAAGSTNVLLFSSVNNNISMATAAPGLVFPPTTTVTTSTMPSNPRKRKCVVDELSDSAQSSAKMARTAGVPAFDVGFSAQDDPTDMAPLPDSEGKGIRRSLIMKLCDPEIWLR
jgi:hypothetical protein